MASIVVSKPYGGSPDVTKENAAGYLYLYGDIDTAESYRICYTSIDIDGVDTWVAEFQYNPNGGSDPLLDWEAADISINPGSLYLGEDLTIGAQYSYIRTSSSSAQGEQGLIPHIETKTASLGTYDEECHAPTVDTAQTIMVTSGGLYEVQSMAIGEIVTLDYRYVLNSIEVETGSLAASSGVSVRVYLGVDQTGTLVFKTRFSQSEFPANSTITLEMDSVLGVEAEQPIYIFFRSSSDISLMGYDDGNDTINLDLNLQKMSELNLIGEDLMLDSKLDHMLDKDNSPMYVSQFMNYKAG